MLHVVLLTDNPDHAKARNWYERAKELGATEAEGQLARLSGD